MSYSVISTVPTNVPPNDKCRGCLHYSRGAGDAAGVCLYGLQPFNCGGGESPATGYAPLAKLDPCCPADQAPIAQAGGPQLYGQVGPAIKLMQVYLGEEHEVNQQLAMTVKSCCEQLDQLAKADCLSCRQGGYYGATSPGTSFFDINHTCGQVMDFEIVKALQYQVPNAIRFLFDGRQDAVLALVYEVRQQMAKGGAFDLQRISERVAERLARAVPIEGGPSGSALPDPKRDAYYHSWRLDTELGYEKKNPMPGVKRDTDAGSAEPPKAPSSASNVMPTQVAKPRPAVAVAKSVEIGKTERGLQVMSRQDPRTYQGFNAFDHLAASRLHKSLGVRAAADNRPRDAEHHFGSAEDHLHQAQPDSYQPTENVTYYKG